MPEARRCQLCSEAAPAGNNLAFELERWEAEGGAVAATRSRSSSAK